MVKLLSFALLLSLAFYPHDITKRKLPRANQCVVDYVQRVMGTQVGTGECSDLMMNARFQVQRAGIKKKAKTKKILPGDFMEFHNAVISGISFPQHFAIIVEVETQDLVVIAHQNHNGDRTVQRLALDLSTLSSGDFKVSHP